MDRRAGIIVFWIIVLSSMVLMLLLIVRPELAPEWSGIGARVVPEGIEGARTLWNWMELLAVPLFLLGSAWWLGTVLRDTSRDISSKHIEAEKSIAGERRSQDTLEAYYQDMMDMLLNSALRDAGKDANVRNAAQARTLAALRSMDGQRKGELLQFLYDAGLLSKRRVIHLKGADLRNAQLAGASLSKAYLWLTNLAGANLERANLNGSDLWLANLSQADLRNARMRGVHLGGANLQGADLRAADLTNANLRKANLRQANFQESLVTLHQLSQAGSLDGVVLPDGTVYEERHTPS